jgi:23S rRNA maturation-related 3'-5' exoribonuclease YhaM
MKITAEQIQMNWVEFMSNIDTYISSPRKEQLKAFYEKFEDRISLMPASHKKEYHSAFPGGYVDHVNRVVKAALSMSAVWEGFGANMDTFTTEELVFSAINHDLGKMGDSEHESYIPHELLNVCR